MSDRILVPIDGSDCSLRALETAEDLARALGATLIVAHVVDIGRAASLSLGEAQLIGQCFDVLRSDGETIVRNAEEHARRIVPHVETAIVQGAPAEEIVRLAEQAKVSWIVMGSHGRTGLSRLLMGSVAEGVVCHAPVPVMIVSTKVRPAAANLEARMGAAT